MRLDHGKFWFHEIQFFEVLQLIWRWVEEFPPNVLEVPLKYKLSMNTWVDAINYVITKHKSFPCKRFTSYLPMWSYKKCNGPFPLTIFAAISRAILRRFQIVRVNYWRLNNCYILIECPLPPRHVFVHGKWLELSICQNKNRPKSLRHLNFLNLSKFARSVTMNLASQT